MRCGPLSQGCCALGYDELVADCISDDRCGQGEVEFTHCRRPVRLDRLDAQIKNCTDLFVGVTFSDQIDDKPLARYQYTLFFDLGPDWWRNSSRGRLPVPFVRHVCDDPILRPP